MAYDPSNPPSLWLQTVGTPVRSMWLYASADPIATVDDSGYITNAGDLRMKSGDVVIVMDTANSLTTLGQVTVTEGAGTITPLTGFPG